MMQTQHDALIARIAIVISAIVVYVGTKMDGNWAAFTTSGAGAIISLYVGRDREHKLTAVAQILISWFVGFFLSQITEVYLPQPATAGIMAIMGIPILARLQHDISTTKLSDVLFGWIEKIRGKK